jgi:CheY-like chemotaxis protein
MPVSAPASASSEPTRKGLLRSIGYVCVTRHMNPKRRGGRHNPLPVLLVEDHAVVLDALRRVLKTEGYNVETAADGHRALGMLRGGVQPCLILLDIDMARQAAYRFRKQLLKDPELAAIPLVAYSGLYEPRIVAAQLRAAAYIKAPFDVNQLLRVIETYCQRRAA